MGKAVLAELDAALDAFAAIDLDALSDAELEEAVVKLAAQRSRLEAEHARLAGRWDSRGVWQASGAKSGAAWLATETRLPKAACGSLLHLARKVAGLPACEAAWRTGEIDAAHVRRVCPTRSARTIEALQRDEKVLVDAARELRFANFEKIVDYWHAHADPDGADRRERDRVERRQLHLSSLLDGVGHLSATLDPISMEIFSTELSRIEQKLFEADRAAYRDEHGVEHAQPSQLARTSAQRRLDALIEMATRSASTSPDARRPRPLFTVIVGYDAFADLCELAASGQTLLSPSLLAPYLRDGDIERIVFDGPSRVIDVSHRRTFDGALRRAIQVRDRECFHPYCDVPAPHCQIDHIEPAATGGTTSLANGRCACGTHNRNRHRTRSRRPPDRAPP